MIINFNTIQNDLRQWSMDENITHKQLTSLLVYLNKNLYDGLPKDARTILSTSKKKVSGKLVDPGEYYHFGITSFVESNYQDLSLIDGFLLLKVNIGGLPISKSSQGCLWPILGSFWNSNCMSPFLIGVYYGYGKPNDVNQYLSEFVDELMLLYENGVQINNNLYRVKIYMINCDTPAKSFMCCTKSHSGFFSCTKCTQSGVSSNRILCFPNLSFTKRCNEVFRERCLMLNSSDSDSDENEFSAYDKFIIKRSCLLNLTYLNFFDDIPIDYMHCICLGVVKRLLCAKPYGLFEGKIPYKLSVQQKSLVNAEIKKIKSFTPREFARKPRDISEVSRWKATEFRDFLLYSGPVILQGKIHVSKFTNFLRLHVATRIFCSKELHEKFFYMAENLLKDFVGNCKREYSKSFISHNVHSLLHISDDVKKFGPLDSFSCFIFENFMKQIKKALRKHEKPLQQLVKRYSEGFFKMEIKSNENFTSLSKEFCPKEIDKVCFKTLKCCKFYFNIDSIADRFVITKSKKIIEVQGFFKEQEALYFFGLTFKNKSSFYDEPIDSKLLSIFQISGIGEKLKIFNCNEIRYKLYPFPLKERTYIVMPILHSSGDN